jgi:hypothetical protein
MIYTAESLKNLFFGYNPTDMVVNDPLMSVSRKTSWSSLVRTENCTRPE